MIKTKIGFSVIEIIIVLIIIGLAATVGWLVYDRNMNKTDKQSSDQSTMSEKTDSSTPSNIVSYSNEEMDLQFMHPKDWGTATVTDYVKSNCDKNIQDFESQNPGTKVTYSGKIYEVNFTENPAKQIFAVTKNYEMNVPLPCQFMIQLPDIDDKIIKTISKNASHSIVVSSDAFEAGTYNYYNFGISDISHPDFRDGTIYTQLSEARDVSQQSVNDGEIDDSVTDQLGSLISDTDRQFVNSIKRLND